MQCYLLEGMCVNFRGSDLLAPLGKGLIVFTFSLKQTSFSQGLPLQPFPEFIPSLPSPPPPFNLSILVKINPLSLQDDTYRKVASLQDIALLRLNLQNKSGRNCKEQILRHKEDRAVKSRNMTCKKRFKGTAPKQIKFCSR